MCNVLTLDDMHASLPDVKYSPPLWWSTVIGYLCLHSKALLVLSMHWLIHVLAIPSVVSAVHILGCLRRLLLLLFITWLCPQVWCCLIHREGFSLLDPSKNYPLAVKKAHRCKLNVLLHGFFSACQIRSWKEMCWHHQWCSSPIFMRWSAHLSFRIDGPTVDLGGMHLSAIHSNATMR